MATTRFGHLDDFTLKNSKVGIGTSTPTEALEVIGGSRSKNIEVTGIATLTSYEGFQNKKTSYVDNIHVDSGESGTLSGEVVIGAGLSMSVGTGATTGQGSIKSLKVGNTFTPPCGRTNDRPSASKPGALFYNKDFKTIEYWDGDFWRQVDNTTRSGRALLTGGDPLDGGDQVPRIESLQISTLGNTKTFGDLLAKNKRGAACSSSTRGLHGGGQTPSITNQIQYVTIASEGDAIDFGDLATAVLGPAAYSSSTRGIWANGYPGSNSNVIQYVEMSTLGDAIDFGDATHAAHMASGCASPTRGVWFVGDQSPATRIPELNFVTIASKGNGIRFGDLSKFGRDRGAASNSVRGIFAGGREPALLDEIDYVTIASEGNAIVFADLIQARWMAGQTASNNTRVVFMSGIAGDGPSYSDFTNRIDFVTISTTGNAQDFGDVSYKTYSGGGCSDSHGGLGGF